MTSGFLNVNKPSGMSSAAVVSVIKRLTGAACGHMGTLDPLASGVLPVAVGNASRLFNYLLDKQKVYLACFRFGTETDTLDIEGNVLRTGGRVPSEEELRTACARFVGEIDQVPPAFSAKSVNGVRAYRLARQGKEVALPPKRVRIDGIEFVKEGAAGEFFFRIFCGGGTYIRSLARDIAAECGTVGIMTSLVREKSGYFTLSQSVSLDELRVSDWRAHLIPPEQVFEMPALSLTGDAARRVGFGQTVPCALSDGDYKLFLDGAFYGIARAEQGGVRAKVKLI